MDKGLNIVEKIKSAMSVITCPEDIIEIEKTILNKLKEKQRKLKKEFENLK